jgi:protein N-terminal amidase
VTVSPTGAILANYRKSFLYYTDETWASEGPGSHTHTLSDPTSPDAPFLCAPLGALGTVTLGICMDINPYKFAAPWDACELARTALVNDCRLVCISMAWLCHLTLEQLMADRDQPDVATIAYWVERFQPLVEACGEEPVYVVLANRSGVEKGAHYAGSSTVMKIEKGEVALYDMAGKSDEQCLVVDLDDRPKFQVRSGVGSKE